MDRGDALSLLKELVSSCKSFYYARAVSITREKEGNGCVLSISWIPDSVDMECMKKIAVKRGLKLTIEQDRVVFGMLPKHELLRVRVSPRKILSHGSAGVA